jgi:hypothetical protein
VAFSRRNFQTGMYAFLRPNSGCYAYSAPPRDGSFAYPLFRNDNYIVMGVAQGTTVAGISAGLLYELSVFNNLEYKTQAQFIAQHYAPYDFSDFEKALSLVHHHPTFYDNPWHLSDILRGIGSAGSRAASHWRTMRGPNNSSRRQASDTVISSLSAVPGFSWLNGASSALDRLVQV